MSTDVCAILRCDQAPEQRPIGPDWRAWMAAQGWKQIRTTRVIAAGRSVTLESWASPDGSEYALYHPSLGEGTQTEALYVGIPDAPALAHLRDLARQMAETTLALVEERHRIRGARHN